jgi:hypothetical protein
MVVVFPITAWLLSCVRIGVEEGVVVELPIVIDAAPPPRESCKGKIAWVEVGEERLDRLSRRCCVCCVHCTSRFGCILLSAMQQP